MTVVVDVHITSHELHEALKRDVRRGLRHSPKELPAKYARDERSAQLLDGIRRLPGFCLGRAEAAVLREHAHEIAKTSGADTLVDIMSGIAERSRPLLSALAGAGTLRRFVPFDSDEVTLRETAETIAVEYAGVEVHAVVGDVEEHVELLPRGGTRLIACLGGGFGSLPLGERATLLDDLRAGMTPADTLLVSADVVHDPFRALADHDGGLTTELSRHLLEVVNSELGGELDPAGFSPGITWDGEHRRIELWLLATAPQQWRLPAAEIDVLIAAGERVRTWSSTIFSQSSLTDELAAAGLRADEWWTDPDADVALVLARPA